MLRIEEEQLKIFYYFMLVDGKCTSEELKNFEMIYHAMGVKEEDVQVIVRDCELAVDISNTDNSERVKKVIQALLERNYSEINNDKQKQIYVIWNLINLGYADKEYSDSEKSVVKFLSDYWKIDDDLLSEMLDTAETMLALVKHKEWIKTTSKPYEVIHESIEKADRDIKELQESMEKTLKIESREG